MKLDQLQYIVEVAKSGSITLAAEILHLSQPNISHAIHSLEKEIGVSIFTRTRSGTKTTEVGKLIIEQAQEILNTVQDIKDTAYRHNLEIVEKLRVGAISGICTSFLPPTLSNFHNKYPKVELEIIEGKSDELEEKLLAGEIDLALVGIPEERDFKHLEAEQYLECKILACVGKNSPLALKKTTSFYEIVQHPIILTSSYMRRKLKSYGELKELYFSSSSESAKHVIAEGLATSFYLDISLRNDPYVTSGKVITLPILENPTIYLYWLQLKKQSTPASSVFIKELLLQVEQFQLIKMILNKPR